MGVAREGGVGLGSLASCLLLVCVCCLCGERSEQSFDRMSESQGDAAPPDKEELTAGGGEGDKGNEEVKVKEEEEDEEEEIPSSLAELLSRLKLVQPSGERPQKLLSEFSLKGVADIIQKMQSSENKQRIIVMTGAGISTAAGIPDFRSPGTGLYDNLQKYKLPDPQAVFHISYFRQNPKPFCMLAKELYPTNFKPTMSHYFIRLLAEKGLLLRNFTQNIDSLERRAGLNPDLLVEAHGGFSTAHCIDCGRQYSEQFVKDCVFRDEIPRCTQDSCRDSGTRGEERGGRERGSEDAAEGEGGEVKGLVKPDIVFFGEALPDRFATCVKEDMNKCDLLIIMGTSLLVHPFASLVDRVRDDCPRLLINRERVGEGDVMMRMMGFASGLDFSEETGYRDVFHKGNCDDGCRDLADLLGWKGELEEMVATEHAKLDAQQTQ